MLYNKIAFPLTHSWRPLLEKKKVTREQSFQETLDRTNGRRIYAYGMCFKFIFMVRVNFIYLAYQNKSLIIYY